MIRLRHRALLTAKSRLLAEANNCNVVPETVPGR